MRARSNVTLADNGAVNGVTGACHELSLHGPGGAKAGVLVDCGIFQGDEASTLAIRQQRADRLVIEATYGDRDHEDRATRRDRLKVMLGDARNDVQFVGYQAVGTPGRDILTHGPRGGWVLLDGERTPIRARIHQVGGYSAHAGQSDLLRFVTGMPQMPAEIRVVYGDDAAKAALKCKLEEAGAGKVLVPGKYWCRESIGAGKVLVPGKYWCRGRPGEAQKKCLPSGRRNCYVFSRINFIGVANLWLSQFC